MFGDWGGFLLQLTVTAIIVLALVAVVYWLVRRYSSGGLGRIGRGRVPRLAVIDAMAVDGRRRLVLVRRDNVEHLLLIGGPSDVVVEQAIQRPRRPAARPAAASQPPGTSDPQPEPPAAVSDNPPIPFPQLRPAQQAAYRQEPAPQPASAPAYPPAQAQPIERPYTPARRMAQQPAARAEPAATVVQFEPMASDPTPLFPDLQSGDNGAVEAPAASARRFADGNGAAEVTAFETSPFVLPSTEQSEETAAKVNDLEREMARLLGEITAKRPS